MTDAAQKVVEITGFKGIRNTASPYAAQLGSLVMADNVVVTKEGEIRPKPGYERLITADAISSSYATLDHKSLFLVDSGVLFVFNGSTVQPLINGLTDTPIYWCEEVGERVFMVGGGGAAVINNRYEIEVIPSIGEPISGIAFHEARLVAAVLRDGYTQIVMTLPYDFTQYDEKESSFTIPDIAVGIQSVRGHLVIAGQAALWMLTPDDILVKLTDYGCVPGKPIAVGTDQNAYVWTTRGLCKVPEFANITLNLSSVPPGSGASVNALDYQGSRFVVVLNDGEGESYNAAFEI